MDTSTHEKWFAELNDSVTEFSSIEALAGAVSDADALHAGRLIVYADAGPRPWWHRLLGVKRWIALYFCVEWEGSCASLNFFDENGSEYRAIDPKGFDDPLEEAAFLAKHPEKVGRCLLKKRALSAAREFLRTVQRPDWLTYDYVR